MATSSTSSVTLLSSVIKQLSATGDPKSREFEKDKISLDLKNADEKLAELVDSNQDPLKKTIVSFGSVCTRVKGCRERIKVLHEKLSRCRKLLHCNRDDLKTHWQEGLECTEKLNLLDKVEKAIQVPEKLQRYVSKKHFLHASKLLVETVNNLDGNLVHVEALRDLRASLHARRTVLHETIIDELNKQIYADTQRPQKKGDMRPEAFNKDKEYFEDLQKDPEDNPEKFIHLMVKSLVVLERIPEVIESFKSRLKPDMLKIIRKCTDQVAKQSIEKGEVLAVEELSNRTNSEPLLRLLQVTFEKFNSISKNHTILLDALGAAKDTLSAEKLADVDLYTSEDIWSSIQFAIKDMLHPYLDIQNLSLPQQTLTSFGNPDSALGSFFTAKKRLNVNVASLNRQVRSTQLFKFECSSSAEAIHSYMREQDIASSVHDDTVADFIMFNPPQLLCKPVAENITVIFLPVVEFVKQIDRETSSKLGSDGVLFNFVSDFVQKRFLNRVLSEVSEKSNVVTKGHDGLRNMCDSHTQRSMNLQRPLLKSVLVIDKLTQHLLELMAQLPQYSNELMTIMIQTLSEFYDSCDSSYKGLVFRDADGKGSRIISSNWVRDEDIKRLISSMPNWNKLKQSDAVSKTDNDAEDGKNIRHALKQDKEVDLLIGNLECMEIEKSQIILDFSDLKSIANLHESAEWLANNIKELITSITGKTIRINVDSFDSPTHSSLTPQSISSNDESIKAMEKLQDLFVELADNCVILLHLEIRVHCFYYIGKATRESSYFINMDQIEVDSQIPPLVKELRDIEDVCSAALNPSKVRYLFDGLSYLLACILISSTSYMKKINRNGVKKMCQNVFTIQQELANITTRREWNLDLARQYFELLYLSPEEILNLIHEQGSYFKEKDYANALELLSRSELPFDKDLLTVRRGKLTEILKENNERK